MDVNVEDFFLLVGEVKALKRFVLELRNIIEDGLYSNYIHNDAIKTRHIMPGQITNEEIEDAAVNASKIANDAVTAIKIAAGSIDVAKFASGLKPIELVDSLPSAGTEGRVVFLTTDKKLYRDTGTEWTSVVPTSDLTGTIIEAQIAALAVTTGKIAANTIEAGNIAAGAIGTDELAALAITTAKMAANAITANKIYAGAVGTDELAALAITADKIAASAITTVKLNALSVTAAKVAVDAITADKIAANTITANKYNELRNTYVFNGDDSLDTTYPFELDFEIVSEMTAIQNIKLSFRIRKFRAYSKAGSAAGTPSGGGHTSGPLSSLGTNNSTASYDASNFWLRGSGGTGSYMVLHTDAYNVINGHQHAIYNHTHPAHTHPAVYGIYEEDTSPTINVYVDNGAGYGSSIGQYTTDQLDINITSHISGTGFKRIKFTSNVRTRIAAWVMCKIDLSA